MQAMDTISKNDLQAVFFRLMGIILKEECSQEMFEKFISDEIFNNPPYGASNADVIEGCNIVTTWLSNEGAVESVQKARKDYMRLFVGPGKLLAPPWGSAYLTKNRLLFQAETLEVREFYRKFGFMIADKYHEPDDHIGLELIFLSLLAERGEYNAINHFIQKYILTWFSDWMQDVCKYSEYPFYPGVARIIYGSLTECINDDLLTPCD